MSEWFIPVLIVVVVAAMIVVVDAYARMHTMRSTIANQKVDIDVLVRENDVLYSGVCRMGEV